MRCLLVGLGRAGTRLVDRVHERTGADSLLERLRRWSDPRGLRVVPLAADAPSTGTEGLRALSEGQLVPLGSGGGTGGNRSKGADTWKRHGGSVRDAAAEAGPWDLALVAFAAGGGTGGASAGPLVETLQALEPAPVMAAPILPFEDESQRIHENAASGLLEAHEAADATFLLANDNLSRPEGGLGDVYQGANTAIADRLVFLLEALSEPGIRTADLADLETVLAGGSGFVVLGYGVGGPGTSATGLVGEALSAEGLSADCDPGEEAARVLLMVEGPKDRFDLEALLDRVRDVVGDRDVLVGARADPETDLRVATVVSLRRSRAVEEVLERGQEAREARLEGQEADAGSDLLGKLDDVEGYDLG